MTFSPRLRKALLTTHVVSSVGWLGAVAAFLVLAVAGRVSEDAGTIRAAYVATGLITTSLIVPLCVASVVSGVVQALAGTWGLFRHYWVVAKLLLTVFATIVLLLQIGPIGTMADVARDRQLAAGERLQDRSSLVLHAAGGLLVLLGTTTLSVFKPRGRTRYGWRREQASGRSGAT